MAGDKIYLKNLRKLRKEHGLSQKKLADLIGSSATAISTYEKGWSVPSFELILKMSKLFNVPIDDLAGEDLSNLIINKEIFLPSFLILPLQKFILSFSEYAKYVKALDFSFDCITTVDSLIIRSRSSNFEMVDTISQYFEEYINLALGTIELRDVRFINNDSLNYQNLTLAQFESEISLLKMRIKFLNAQNGNLIDELNFLRTISHDLLASNNKLLEDGKAQIGHLNSKVISLQPDFTDYLKVSDDLYRRMESYITDKFLEQEIKQLENFIELQEVLEQMLTEKDLKAKIKIAVPLLNIVGVTVEKESEFDLLKLISKLKDDVDSLMIKKK